MMLHAVGRMRAVGEYLRWMNVLDVRSMPFAILSRAVARSCVLPLKCMQAPFAACMALPEMGL